MAINGSKIISKREKKVNFTPIPAAGVPGDFDGEFLLPTLQAYSAGRCVAIVQGRELRDDLLLGAKTFNQGSYHVISIMDVL
jgi:hypothetical protein